MAKNGAEKDRGAVLLQLPQIVGPSIGRFVRRASQQFRQQRGYDQMRRFRRVRLVVRTGGGPLIEELLPHGRWAWKAMAGRTQDNRGLEEQLIIKEEA